MTPPPLSLYIHLPWCVRKCPYCDFNSHALRGILPQEEYIDALLADLDHELGILPGPRPLVSIFLGGGTPSLFAPGSIERLLSGIHRRMSFVDDIEITLEANPGTIERGRFNGYRTAGINRLSLGVQSFNDAHLERLGRIHNRDDALRAVEEAYMAGLENLNLDLMYGLPEQGVDEMLDDLQQATALDPTHISWYQLTLEPNTAFHQSPPPLPGHDALWDMHKAGLEFLAARGFRQYEVSAHAREDRVCRHNLNYWTFGDYLGIGAGAHGKLTLGKAIQRRWKPRHPAEFMDQAGEGALSGTRLLDRGERVFEFLLNALRLNRGFTTNQFQKRTGVDITTIEPALQSARTDGLLHTEGEKWMPTERGRALLDTLLERFLP